MGLPIREWLPQAQRLAVGASARVRHNNEPTAAMVVANLPDRWIAKCHRCGEGGVQMKTHAVLPALADQKRFMPWPKDAKAFDQWPMHVQEALYKMLLTKGFDWQVMAPEQPLWYSEDQGRLLFGTKEGWIGRATGGQLPKWVGYGFPAPAYGAFPSDPILPYVVLTEDYLSALKVRWAMRGGLPTHTAQAVLGTSLKDKHLVDLVQGGCRNVWCMLDGDKGGDKGNVRIAARARGVGLSVRVLQTPRGDDPKDLTKEEILNVLSNR